MAPRVDTPTRDPEANRRALAEAIGRPLPQVSAADRQEALAEGRAAAASAKAFYGHQEPIDV